MADPARYCPACYVANGWDAELCSSCGTSLETDDSYDERLIWALDHPDTATAMLAAELLGRRGHQSAIGRLIQATESHDPYRAAAAARALTAFNDERARAAVRALHGHRSALIRRAVSQRLGRQRGDAPGRGAR